MRANEFITEALVKKYNYENLDLDYAKKLMDRYCTEARPMLSKPLWRGMSNHTKGDVILINPSSGKRESQNTSNHYTLLIDSSPYMQDWPKRSSSLICSTSMNYAYSYAYDRKELFALFPVDGAKIAVCPKPDMWATDIMLPEFNMFFRGTNYNMDSFNTWLLDLGINDNIESFKNAHTKEEVTNLCKKYKVDPKQFIPILYNALSPKRANFRLMTIPEFIKSGVSRQSHECWVGDNVVAIRAPLWEQMTK